MAPLSTRITATLANASDLRSISFEYQQTPIHSLSKSPSTKMDALRWNCRLLIFSCHLHLRKEPS